jgi:hypothetical protein
MKGIILIFSFLIFTVSCASIDTSRIAPGYIQAFKAMKNVIVGYEDKLITKGLVKNIPYASSSMKIGRGPAGLIILESINSDQFTWVSADGVFLVTRNGRIIKTAGLNNNLTEFNSPFRKTSFLNQADETSYSYYFSYDVPYLTNLEVKAKINKKGEVKVQLLGGERLLTLIEEEISNDFIGWSAVNKFWLDEEGFVWKSEQHISPKVPKIVLEVTKKPS